MKSQKMKLSTDLKKRMLFTFIILFFIQFISNIPTFGINMTVVNDLLNSETGNAFGFFSMFSGSAFSNMSIFVIGISPYITSSIILQLLRVVIPALETMSKDGKVGMDKFNKITYIVAGVLAILQTIPIVIGFANYGLLIENNIFYISLVSILLILGSIVLIYLGHIIDKKGIGKGISLILLTNILSNFPRDILTIYEMFLKNKPIGNWIITILFVMIIVSITLIGIIYLQDGEKRIKTQYSSQVKGMNSLQGKGSVNFIPLKVNLAGVMPIIFTSSIFQMFILIVSLLKVEQTSIFYKIANMFNFSNWFQLENPLYNIGYIIYCILIFAFSYFYCSLVFDTNEVAENLRKCGGVIVGVRPGKPTVEYLDKKMKTLRTVGSICLIIVMTIPMFISNLYNIQTLAFNGTSIIIVVGVILETYKIIETEKIENSSSSFLF